MRSLLVSSLFLAATVAQAGELRPMIEIGGGGAAGLADGGGFLVRVGFSVAGDSGSDGINALYLARLKGDVVATPDGTLPYLDLEFVPIALGAAADTDRALQTEIGTIRLLPTRVTRDVRLNESYVVRVDVLGLSLDMPISMPGKVELFARVAADALGYKVVSHVNQTGTFHGLNVLDAELGVGARFNATDKLSVRILVGGAADVNLGGSGNGVAFQSDMKAFARLSADVSELVRFFVEGSLRGTVETGGPGFLSHSQLLAGAVFFF
jgi:hypothetical protein